MAQLIKCPSQLENPGFDPTHDTDNTEPNTIIISNSLN